ncbi:Germin-like protein subfamily 3 member 4 [Linum grandiflorum]
MRRSSNSMMILCLSIFCILITHCCKSDETNLQDTCPTAPTTKQQQTIFINGYPCKNPANVTASDFKSSKLDRPGKTDTFLRSALTLVTAFDFAGLNTLGLSMARTDLEVDGLQLPHSHPRASEILFVSQGVVLVGFVDTENKLFQKTLKAGDVFLFPRALLHFCLNAGFEKALVFSFLNSQNPGLVTIADAMFVQDREQDTMMATLVNRIKSVASKEASGVHNT